MTNLSSMPPEERPRERLVTRGIGALSEPELLALVLRSGSRGVSALDAGAALLEKYGSVPGIAAASFEELAGASGLGPAKAASLTAAFQLGRLARVRGGAERRRHARREGSSPAAPG